MTKRKFKFQVFNSQTGRSIRVKSTSEMNARNIGRRRGLDTKKGIIKAFRVKK